MNGALRDAAVQTLHELAHEVEISDLHAQRFQAVASKADLLNLRNPERFGYVHEQRQATATRGYSRDILAEQDKLMAAEFVIFQFPLWWYAVPAILKGWADRVLTYGFAYTDECLFERGLAPRHANHAGERSSSPPWAAVGALIRMHRKGNYVYMQSDPCDFVGAGFTQTMSASNSTGKERAPRAREDLLGGRLAAGARTSVGC